MDWRLASHHGLSHGYLARLALNQHLPGLLAHHGNLLAHHLSGLLPHHLTLLAHHRPHLLPHHLSLLLDHHLPRLLLELLLLGHHLPHHLALNYLHLTTRRSHLHPRPCRPHEPPLHHLHVLSLHWRPHPHHVRLGGALPVLGRHMAGARGHGVDRRHGGGGGVGRPAQGPGGTEGVLVVESRGGHVGLRGLDGET